MPCGPRKAGVARRGVGLGLGGVLLAHGRRKKALTGGSRALARRGGGGTGLGQEWENGLAVGVFWAAGKEKEREREEKGWAGWAEKRKGVKERLFHFF